jgi:S-methylmethionine-dependent homocysteine/selenocysteine methylase
VLTTAYQLTPEEQKEAIANAGADLWLPKPLPKFNELQGILEKVISERRIKRNAKKVKKTEPDTRDETA